MKTELKWVTSNEMNNTSHFIVEKSVDGIRFSPIGTVAALEVPGMIMIIFFDDNPNEGYSYYRLKQVDADAKAHTAASLKSILQRIVM